MHIYDKEFTQTELPMTKQEIRAVSIAKLMLKPNSILIDVGAGTGTIGIEAATYMPQGKVYAIEKEEKGLDTIKLNAEMMLDKYKDIIPKKLEELIELPGVGRKTANVVLGELWNIREGIVVDTHVKRLSNRIGFVKNDNPEIIERELMKFIPKKYWFVYSHYLILHGRDKCIARKPKCEICEIRDYCKYNEENAHNAKGQHMVFFYDGFVVGGGEIK